RRSSDLAKAPAGDTVRPPARESQPPAELAPVGTAVARPRKSGATSREADATARMSTERAGALLAQLDDGDEGADESETRAGTPSGLRHQRGQSDADRTYVDRAPPPARGDTDLEHRSPPAERPAATTAPAPEASAPPASVDPLDGSYSGRLVLATLRFIARKFGERALKELLESMPAEHRAPFVQGIAEDSWVSLTSVRVLVEHADRRLGEDDLHLVLEAGRAAAEGAFDVMRELRPPTPPPELIVEQMPTILKSVIRGVDVEVRRVGRGYGRLEMLERAEPSLTLAVGTLGFIARSLERFGADDVEVNLLSARALDDPQTLIDVSWFA
ncbi:MAG: hypothetical protein AB7P00_41170, partial [Sandaracinaceae bacterium]